MVARASIDCVTLYRSGKAVTNRMYKKCLARLLFEEEFLDTAEGRRDR